MPRLCVNVCLSLIARYLSSILRLFSCDVFSFFFFNDTATTEIYTLSLHDALPIWACRDRENPRSPSTPSMPRANGAMSSRCPRSEEHTSELQSRQYLVCRLLLEKKKTKNTSQDPTKKKRTTMDDMATGSRWQRRTA